MSASLPYVAVGTFLIGFGGLRATYGWDLKSSEDTRIALANGIDPKEKFFDISSPDDREAAEKLRK